MEWVFLESAEESQCSGNFLDYMKLILMTTPRMENTVFQLAFSYSQANLQVTLGNIQFSSQSSRFHGNPQTTLAVIMTKVVLYKLTQCHIVEDNTNITH